MADDPRSLIHSTYLDKCATPGDINEHLPTLQGLAAQCSTIAGWPLHSAHRNPPAPTELGVRSVVSTWALLDGLCTSPATAKRMLCMDIEHIPSINEVAQLAAQCDVDLSFVQGDRYAAYCACC